MSFTRIKAFALAAAWTLCLTPASPARSQSSDLPSPTPRELWERLQKTLPPFTYEVLQDRVVPSLSEAGCKLRRIDLRFVSQEIDGVKMGHSAVVFLPSDPAVYRAPTRRGKVVVYAAHFGDTSAVGNYGDPIASRTGYPTMVVTLPGDYGVEDGEIRWLRLLRERASETRDPFYHDFFRSAVPYLRALDVFADLLDEKKIQAVIGGHSKRAFYAYNAAAIDPDRIVSVVYMGCESLFSNLKGYLESVSPFAIQPFVKASVLYLGATNEDGYEMFNINKIRQNMKQPWALEYIPNYRHASNSEVQFLDWQMWVRHMFEGRPLTKISGLSFEETPTGTRFRARIDTPNAVVQVKVWYVYCDDVPYWRDLVWYPQFMTSKDGVLYEAEVGGKLPDSWLVEVKDSAGGTPGYLSSDPQDITHKPTKERHSRGSRSRNWEPKKTGE